MGKKYSDGKDYKVIAFVHARFSAEEQQELVKKIARKSVEYNCRVVFFSTLTNFHEEDLDSGEIRIFDTIPIEKFDAVVLMAETFKTEEGQAAFVHRATVAGVPMIAVDHYIPGCINISFDYAEAFRKIVKHMVEFHGYRNINFMAGVPNNSFSEERIGVFKEVLAENNIPLKSNSIYYGYFWEGPTKEAMREMLEEDNKLPEAIICANDTMALTVCDFLSKRGIRVPEDVAVSGFDGLEAGRYHQPQLLTSVYDINVFADALFRLVNGEECVVGEKTVPISAYGKIQIGGSCGCTGIAGIDAAAKIIQIKSDMNEQMEYLINLGRMVANYGESEGMEIVQKAIPEHMKYMNYFNFWFCSEKRLLIVDFPNALAETQEEHGWYNSICYKKYNENVDISYAEHVAKEYLVPDIENQLDSEHPLLVVTIPNQEDPNAYAVISIDAEKFWYTAYANFIFHLRFLLDMQRSKKKLLAIYRTDDLTGVLNRNGFYAMLDKIMLYSKITELTVISIDMCDFKQINDTYGHAEGDNALREVGNILRKSISQRDFVARIGGDEFVIVLFRENQKQRTEEIIKSINRKAEEFNEKNEKNYKLIFSIGVCSEEMGDKSLDYFLRIADQKMYMHKKEQKQGK